jgi:galactokinase
VKLAKWVENSYIGLHSGIMDQFSVAFGEKNKALMLNCDTLDYQAVNSNLGEYLLAIINTNKPRKLAESKYNERVQECSTALAALQTELDINHLCDIDTETFNHKHLITDEVILNRATHVVEENDRVKLAAKALSNNDLAEFGRLMYASHHSLSTLYEVSGKELDTIVNFCKPNKDVIGARMTGAGFGGCAIALVKKDAFENSVPK